jgi:hypothetical protein
MNNSRRSALLWILTIVLLPGGLLVLTSSAEAQRKSPSGKLRRAPTAPRTAYERGYDAGYADGYNSGKSDYNSKLDRDYQRSNLYQQANRGYEQGFGELAEYQDGYRLGYEIAYTDGYYGRAMNKQMPPNAAAMRSSSAAVQAEARQTDSGRPVSGASAQTRRVSGSLIPDRTELKLRLTEAVNTKIHREGDRFRAKVVEPAAYEGAEVEGHIAKLNRSGKLTGRTELSLEFDTITLPDGRTAPFRAEIEKIYASESIKSVDEEGNIETASKTKDTQIRTAGGAALGAIIGAIAGGGKGAAIGAIVGAGAGAGSVYVQGNKDIILDVGTEMSVRTASPQRERTQ